MSNPGGPMTVWVVYNEWQNQEPDIVGVYTTADRAAIVRQQTVDAHLQDGFEVYFNPATAQEGSAEWDVDVRVSEQPLRT